ncbi:MAG: HEAT repeat domain-containing protein [Anaerolineae bacterium]|nr:HEAT repeat domain-containing protein [Anaerolineae bacterium]
MSNSSITGREPQLVAGFLEKGKQRLSLRRLGTMLNILSPDAVSLDAIAEMVQSDDFFVRYNAAKLLGKRGDRDARILIEDALSNAGARTRASVARHLYGFTWFSAEPLIKQALKDGDARVREAAIYALCDMGDLNAYNLMVDTLDGEEDNVLEAAAFGLRETQDSAAVPVLKQVLKAKDPDVRIKGLEALGISGVPEAMPVVREAMFDPEPQVKYAASLSLLELAGESWLEELAGVIGRTTGETLEQVLLALFHATNYLKIDVAKSKAAELMIDALETALLDEHAGVRKAAIYPLAWMRHDRTPVILKKTYRLETDPDVKAHIVRVSAGLMSDAGEEILQDAMDNEDAKVRKVAQQIMEEREKAGGRVATYDENAYKGEEFDRSLLLGKLS